MSTQLSPQPIRVAVAPRPSYGRGRPLITLVFSAVVTGLHHLWVMWQQSTYTSLLIISVVLMPALGALALAGLVYPPVFYAITNAGKPLPAALKVLAGIIALAGAAAGVYCGQLLYHFL